jgi:hypothetical protein
MAKCVHHVAHKKGPHIEIDSSAKLFCMCGKRRTKSPVKPNREVARAVSPVRHFCVEQI